MERNLRLDVLMGSDSQVRLSSVLSFSPTVSGLGGSMGGLGYRRVGWSGLVVRAPLPLLVTAVQADTHIAGRPAGGAGTL